MIYDVTAIIGNTRFPCANIPAN